MRNTTLKPFNRTQIEQLRSILIVLGLSVSPTTVRADVLSQANACAQRLGHWFRTLVIPKKDLADILKPAGTPGEVEVVPLDWKSDHPRFHVRSHRSDGSTVEKVSVLYANPHEAERHLSALFELSQIMTQMEAPPFQIVDAKLGRRLRDPHHVVPVPTSEKKGFEGAEIDNARPRNDEWVEHVHSMPKGVVLRSFLNSREVPQSRRSKALELYRKRADELETILIARGMNRFVDSALSRVQDERYFTGPHFVFHLHPDHILIDVESLEMTVFSP